MDKATAVLKRLEWSASYSYCTGWPACPICKGIKPGHGRDERGVLPDNQGHRPGCALADVLAVPNLELSRGGRAETERGGATTPSDPTQG